MARSWHQEQKRLSKQRKAVERAAKLEASLATPYGRLMARRRKRAA